MPNKKCIHGKTRVLCKECGSNSYCIHNKLRTRCVECGGGSICEHHRRRADCKLCKGSNICIHEKRKDSCKQCMGTSYCEHNKLRKNCKECHGSSICKHNKFKQFCRECDGSRMCEHGIKQNCKECGGLSYEKYIKSKTCITDGCDTFKKNKYKGYCMKCFMHIYPNEPITRNYKIKEVHITTRVKEQFPDYTWVCDKRYDFASTDCRSLRRPDMYCHFGEYILIVEVDENQHEDYDTSCDNKRLCELFQDFGCIPIIFIRFNPDDYIDADGRKVTSCFGTTPIKSITHIKKNKAKEFEQRIQILFKTIKKYSNSLPNRSITQVHLFFDKDKK